MRKQVEVKLCELENMGVIEKVSGQISWMSPLVVVPKPNGQIQICLDLRQGNLAVPRKQFLKPNVEDTLQEMNGSNVFSRCDLRQAFHQIELDEKSRYIMTFACHKGLFRYKRLFLELDLQVKYSKAFTANNSRHTAL